MQAGGVGMSLPARRWVHKVRSLLPLPWCSVVDAVELPESLWLVTAACGTWVRRGQPLRRFLVSSVRLAGWESQRMSGQQALECGAVAVSFSGLVPCCQGAGVVGGGGA